MELRGVLTTINNVQQSDLHHIDGQIVGSLSRLTNLAGILSDVPSIIGGLSPTGGASTIPYYGGAYTVTPVAELDVVLETAGKRMGGDVVVKEIPYYETSNDSGGYTVIIG